MGRLVGQCGLGLAITVFSQWSLSAGFFMQVSKPLKFSAGVESPAPAELEPGQIFELVNFADDKAIVRLYPDGVLGRVDRRRIDPHGFGYDLFKGELEPAKEYPKLPKVAARPPAPEPQVSPPAQPGPSSPRLNSPKAEARANRCDVKPKAPKCFGFSAENASRVRTANGSKKVSGNCDEEMLGYTVDEPSRGKRLGAHTFAYTHGFCGPTGSGGWTWKSIGREERAWCARIASRCGIQLPAQKNRWLGVDGMKCLIKEVVAKLPAGTHFEIDNSSHLRSPYDDQYEFVKKFSELMTEAQIFNRHMVMKNINSSEARRIVADLGPGRSICNAHLSPFIINEEEFLGSRRQIQAALSCGGFSIAQSVDTTQYGVVDQSVPARTTGCEPSRQIASRRGQQ